MTHDYQNWFDHPDIKPYIYVRSPNRPKDPGSLHKFIFKNDWLDKDPFYISEADFATSLLKLENAAFRHMGLTMQRWALYDCSIMPGCVVGFAMRTSALTPALKKAAPFELNQEWSPLSMFICIPTNEHEHWVAHNLCSINSLLSPKDRLPKLGFLSKAFGIWYFNIKNLYGVTQWGSNSIKVHSNYGLLRLVTAYTPIHDFPDTLTYLVEVDSEQWTHFMDLTPNPKLHLKESGLIIKKKDEAAMKALQLKIEKAEGPFYINGNDFIKGAGFDQFKIYTR